MKTKATIIIVCFILLAGCAGTVKEIGLALDEVDVQVRESVEAHLNNWYRHFDNAVAFAGPDMDRLSTRTLKLFESIMGYARAAHEAPLGMEDIYRVKRLLTIELTQQAVSEIRLNAPALLEVMPFLSGVL